MKLIIIAVQLLIFSTALMATTIKMPSEKIRSITARVANNTVYCLDSRFQSIDEIEISTKKFISWYLIRANIEEKPFESTFEINLYNNIWRVLDGILSSDQNITKTGENVSGDIEWDIPRENVSSFVPFISKLKGLKREIQTRQCIYNWNKVYVANNKDTPSQFIGYYNNQVYRFHKLREKCVKPNIEGWTNDKSAIEYSKCLDSTRNEHNMLVKKLKTLDSIYDMYKPLLESLGLDKNIKKWGAQD